MNLEKLLKFNDGYGFPLHRSNFLNSKRSQLLRTTLAAVPVLGIALMGVGRKNFKEAPGISSRAILATTIVGLPIIFLLDIIATLVTQPIGRHLEKKARQERRLNFINEDRLTQEI